MTEEQQKVETVVEEPAAEVPTSEPVVEETPASEEDNKKESEATAAGNETAEKEKPKVSRRFTFNKRWGKHRDEPQIAKDAEQPKDPKEDIIGWISQQIPQAVHKVNYLLLDWLQRTAVDESELKQLPGKDGFVTRNQLLAFLRDGDVLTKLANKLQAGAIEPVAVEENADQSAVKEAQKNNIDKFSQWLQENVSIEKEKVFTSGDLLEKGKGGYTAVFESLWQLAINAKDKFNVDAIDIDGAVNAAGQVVKNNLIQTILGFFRRSRQTAVTEQNKEEAAQEEQPAEPEKIETTAPAAVVAN